MLLHKSGSDIKLMQNMNTPITKQEVLQFRALTKGTAECIHFNNAGSSLPADSVVNTVVDYLLDEAMNGGYETEFNYQAELENTYLLIARLINAETNEVAIVENASLGWGLAFNGIQFESGDEVITSEMEYSTNLLGYLNAKQLYGIDIKYIEQDKNGNFPLADLESAITPRTKLIAVTHIASGSGTMLPIVEIGAIAKKNRILYMVDACQTIGHMPIDVKEINCDMLSVTGRKYLRAPRGTGFLFVKKDVQPMLKTFFMDSHTASWVSETEFSVRDDARRFELYEKNRGLCLGLSKAVELALSIGVDRIWQRVQMLGDLLRVELKKIPGVIVHDQGDLKCGIVTFSSAGVTAGDVKKILSARRIHVSVANAASTLLYMNHKHLDAIVRASVHYYNTEEEIAIMCEILKSVGK